MIASNNAYITPLDSTGVEVTARKRKGVFTLLANTTYYYIFGGAAATCTHLQLTGYTAGAVITSATIQSCSQGREEVTDFSATVGEWINEDPTTADVRVDGTGWSQSSPGIVAANGTGVGGASWQLGIGWSPARTRIQLVVGTTGGDFVVAMHGKA